jgi:CheY-like chemotaxis protein
VPGTLDAMLQKTRHALYDVRLLVADDHELVRTFYVRQLQEIDGVGSVIPAGDGVEAVRLAGELELDVAVLDLNMPRLDGIAAARELTALQPALAIALHSSDPDMLRDVARDLDLPLFDKFDVDRVVAWVAREVASRRGLTMLCVVADRSCARCGYGVATDPPPSRCPMCNSATEWTRDSQAPRRVIGF